MNHKHLFYLLALPAVASSMLTTVLIAASASAADRSVLPATSTCDAPTPTPLQSSSLVHQVLVASAGGPLSDDSLMDFSIAESDAAATLFGCDCPACIGALRQLQKQSLSQNGLSGSKGHCLSSLQRRQVSPETVQEVLSTLEADKLN